MKIFCKIYRYAYSICFLLELTNLLISFKSQCAGYPSETSIGHHCFMC